MPRKCGRRQSAANVLAVAKQLLAPADRRPPRRRRSQHQRRVASRVASRGGRGREANGGLRQNGLRRNTMMTAPGPVAGMLGAPRSGSAFGHMAHAAASAAPEALGVYKPRRPQASPLFRLVQDHLDRLRTVCDGRFARAYGPWRPVVGEVTTKFLACGILEHGFARIRCDACAHEYLLAFSCKGRYFCPSCHAKRLAIWAQWLDTTLLARVPHRQVRAAPASRAHGSETAPRILSLPPTPARRDRPGRRPHGHRRDPDLDRRA